MFGVRGERPMMQEVDGKGMIVPLERYGIKLLSIGLLVDEKNAVVWRGPMASSAIRQFVTDVLWGELDYLVIDMPPGTGDIHLTLVQTVPVTGVVVVTTPQDVALADAKKGIAMFGQAQLKVPIILGQIPLVQSIREGGDQGIPVMVSDDEISKRAFQEFAAAAARSISMRNANMSATEVAEVVEEVGIASKVLE
jgi:ATP-binding protein involved in chromosome partitioning